MLDLIVKGGQVVTPQGADVMDVGVQGGKIVAVGWLGTLAADAARVIDATGKIVVPGGIEPHAHIGIPVPEHWAGTPDVFTQPPEAAWGNMLSTARSYIDQSIWMSIFPGVAIMIVVLGFNFLGDGLRDILDPRLGPHVGGAKDTK